mmetsp:Transcript_10242/g.31291  ORF Transcript_10242/g.31291 Transcript_10242/m.31291 type:complete len:472 (-) Transcript_10242:144-1559(-)
MDDRCRAVCLAIYREEHLKLREVLNGAQKGAVLVTGEDAWDVVRYSTCEQERVGVVSCMEASCNAALADVWPKHSRVVVVRDVDALDGGVDRTWISSLCSKLDTRAEGHEQIVIGECLSTDQVERSLLRAGRFDKVIQTSNGSGLKNRIEAFAALGAEHPEILAKNSPGYDVKDMFGVVRQKGLEWVMHAGEQDLLPPSRRLSHAHTRRASWAQIGGYEENKTSIRKICEWPLKYPQTYEALGVTPPVGLLLHGPSGCGKTLFAAALAGEIRSVNFLGVRGTDIYSKYLGETEASIRAVFSKARSILPCVLFFDEIDAICRSRNETSDLDIDRRVVGTLLAELDGLASSRKVFFLACTNRLDLVDAAVLRPGRIDHLMEIPLPALDDRLAVLRVHMRQFGLSDDSLRQAAAATAGQSCASLQAIAKNAAMRAVRQNRRSLGEGPSGSTSALRVEEGHLLEAAAGKRLSFAI